jgi:hypothetical protein
MLEAAIRSFALDIKFPNRFLNASKLPSVIAVSFDQDYEAERRAS